MNREALQKIGYGMYIVCSRKDGKFNGQIANTVFQITSSPPTVAVSINRNNLTHEFIEASKVFTATVLCQDTPLPFIGRFGFRSGREIDKFEGVEYVTGVTGAPVVTENAASYFEARVIQQIEVGTHTLYIGEVINAEMVSQKVCMTYEYYQQVKRGTTPRAAPTYVEKPKMEKSAKYRCTVCGYIYDPEKGDADGGIKPGTPFEQLPDSWVCPICGADKSAFEKV